MNPISSTHRAHIIAAATREAHEMLLQMLHICLFFALLAGLMYAIVKLLQWIEAQPTRFHRARVSRALVADNRPKYLQRRNPV